MWNPIFFLKKRKKKVRFQSQSHCTYSVRTQWQIRGLNGGSSMTWILIKETLHVLFLTSGIPKTRRNKDVRLECASWTKYATKTKCDHCSFILRCKCECVLCLFDWILSELWCDCVLCLVGLIVSHLKCDVIICYVWLVRCDCVLCLVRLISKMWLYVMFG